MKGIEALAPAIGKLASSTSDVYEICSKQAGLLYYVSSLWFN